MVARLEVCRLPLSTPTSKDQGNRLVTTQLSHHHFMEGLILFHVSGQSLRQWLLMRN